MKQLEILIPAAVNHGFDYAAPEGMALSAGDIVSVPLGKKMSIGVVWGDGKARLAPEKLKPVAMRHDFPPLSEAMRKFIDWSAWYNCAPRGMVLKMALPVSGIEKKGRIKNPLPAPLPLKEEGSGGKAAAGESCHLNLAQLSAVQEAAAENIKNKSHDGFSVTLLDGVTGSGKTEVYFDVIAEMLGIRHEALGIREDKFPSFQSLKPNPQCLVLLPEIALSVQWLKRFEERFGFKPVIWNSEITPAKRRVNWQSIAKGEVRVVVGARSALFLPYPDLRLIVVDEEHDTSYKQEEGVIYNARDMAVARAQFEKLPVILVSATPSLESYYNARQGKYDEVILPVRHAEAVLPDIEMIDMRQQKLTGGNFISQTLRDALLNTVAQGHQAMLFLNRRGYAPLMLCRHCGHRFQCPDCSSWLVMHKKGGRHWGLGIREESSANPQSPMPNAYLECHHCNFHMPVPDACPACAAKECLHACGPGVERVLEEARTFMPEARIAVMASDSMGSYKELSDTINAMIEKKIDLLIGTQMIAKGHHFADLGAVGVVDADLGLSGGDLRASERTYQLLHQLSGRAGRERIRGKVYLQSFLPEHPVMKALISGDREAFLSAELQARQNAGMPPFTRLAAIIVEGAKEELVIQTARQLAARHKAQGTIHLLGPAPAPLYRLRNKYRMRLLLRAGRDINLPDYIRGWLETVETPSSVRVRVDIDPVSFL